jgi:hypothetical protein
MTKLKWDRQIKTSTLDSEYWANPKTGFDKEWHQARGLKNKKVDKESLGVHAEHELDIIKLESGPHAGKLTCKTCNKFIKWLPKEAF